ncbi:MAG: hypothetical protein GY859_12360 [Desulfobacterales bacterium]|nr:hypothetical protein [Desulfobacterales bacterium]
MNKPIYSAIFTVFLISFLMPGLLFSQGIVIDHTCTDITRIPDRWIAQVQSVLKVHYCHTSHGSQITEGMERLANADSKYAYYPDNCNVPDTTAYYSLMDGQYIGGSCETYLTPEYYWQGSDALNYTRTNLNSIAINMSLWAWI